MLEKSSTLLAMTGYGKIIRDAREAASLKKVELAGLVHVHPSIIGKIEEEKSGVTATVYCRLVAALPETLKAVDLLEAIGFYPVALPEAQRLPRGLVKLLLPLRPADYRTIADVARGLRLAPARSPRMEE